MKGLGLTEALQKSVGGESCSLASDPVPFSLLPVAQKVVALRKKQQLSIGPCKSLPNSPSHSSVSAASIPSVHINQVGNGHGEGSWQAVHSRALPGSVAGCGCSLRSLIGAIPGGEQSPGKMQG